ncbi:MAG: transposase [Bacteroidota bacterium]
MKEKPYHKFNWHYGKQEDYFVCPQGVKLPFLEHRQVVNKNGYEQQVKVYESESCQGCPVFEACRGQKANKASNRRIQVNENLEAHRAKAKQLLESEEGKKGKAS